MLGRLRRAWLPMLAAILVGAIMAVVAGGQETDSSPQGTVVTSSDEVSTPPVETQPVDPANLPDVGDGTEEIQIPDEIPKASVDFCRDYLQDHPDDEGCQLLLKAANGEIEPGVYPE